MRGTRRQTLQRRPVTRATSFQVVVVGHHHVPCVRTVACKVLRYASDRRCPTFSPQGSHSTSSVLEEVFVPLELSTSTTLTAHHSCLEFLGIISPRPVPKRCNVFMDFFPAGNK